MVVGFTTTYAISAYHHWSCEFESRPGEVYSIQHYVIKFVSDLRYVSGFLRALPFPPPIKLTATIYVISEILLKVALNTITLTPITTNFFSSNPTHGKVYSIQQYVMKFVSDLQQVGDFLQIHWFPPPIKLIATIYM